MKMSLLSLQTKEIWQKNFSSKTFHKNTC